MIREETLNSEGEKVYTRKLEAFEQPSGSPEQVEALIKDFWDVAHDDALFKEEMNTALCLLAGAACVLLGRYKRILVERNREGTEV